MSPKKRSVPRHSPIAEISKEVRRTLANRISAWVPIFISALALLLSAFVALRNVNHQQLSVKPAVRMPIDMDKRRDLIGIFVENNGLGPALFESFEIVVDDKSLSGNDLDSWEKVIRDNIELFQGKTPSWHVFNKGFILRPGQRIAIFATSPEYVSDDQGYSRLIHERIKLKIRFCSLYRECEETCTGCY